ncbi:MAG: hypothetical protein KJ000_36280, partial [Pirellulaceae bacterium]|nr:hypothetical protein [Pirellulaceae bacterium]
MTHCISSVANDGHIFNRGEENDLIRSAETSAVTRIETYLFVPKKANTIFRIIREARGGIYDSLCGLYGRRCGVVQGFSYAFQAFGVVADGFGDVVEHADEWAGDGEATEESAPGALYTGHLAVADEVVASDRSVKIL